MPRSLLGIVLLGCLALPACRKQKAVVQGVETSQEADLSATLPLECGPDTLAARQQLLQQAARKVKEVLDPEGTCPPEYAGWSADYESFFRKAALVPQVGVTPDGEGRGLSISLFFHRASRFESRRMTLTCRHILADELFMAELDRSYQVGCGHRASLEIDELPPGVPCDASASVEQAVSGFRSAFSESLASIEMLARSAGRIEGATCPTGTYSTLVVRNFTYADGDHSLISFEAGFGMSAEAGAQVRLGVRFGEPAARPRNPEIEKARIEEAVRELKAKRELGAPCLRFDDFAFIVRLRTDLTEAYDRRFQAMPECKEKAKE